MQLSSLATRNVLRNRFRTIATALGVAVAILAFVLLRTVVSAWTEGAEYAAKDRLGTRHKVSFILSLPLRYVAEVEQIPGVKRSMGASWFGAKHPTREQEFFATIAVQSKAFFEVYDEIQVPEAQRAAWMENRKGAIVGRVLAKKFGWNVGDRVKLRGTIYPGDWDFEISGIYDSQRRSVDLASFFFHYDYLNDSVPARRKDQIGWIASRIDSSDKAAQISKQIDEKFDERDIQTLSMSEKALNNSFMGMFAAVLGAMDLVSIVILLIMMLILGNTVAMGVRERTHEYGVLRAIGFLPRHLASFVLGEAAAIGALGGGLGLLLSYPVVEKGLGRFLEENMSGFFPVFRIDTSTTIQAFVFATLLGLIAAAIPAYRTSKLNVIDALRRVG
ncbi:MAG TPA: ABC transporter permease [Polyangiaceae bacterium]|jgi:putative ABC transport system permease protein|nr:ABC transporter permease [Polyangiaceae bacterium]